MACLSSTMSGASAIILWRLVYSQSWWLMICQLRLVGALGYNIHMCPLHMAWAFSQYGGWIPRMSLLREPGRRCVKFFMTKPRSCMLSFIYWNPFMDAVTSPFPDSRGGNKYRRHHTLGAVLVTLKSTRNGINVQAWPSFQNAVFHIQCAPNWICSYTQTCSTPFVFYINEQNQRQFSCPRQNIGIIPDSSLSLTPFPINHQAGSLLTLWEPSDFFTFHSLC